MRDTSTPFKRPESTDIGIQYSSEEEGYGHTGETVQIRNFPDSNRTTPQMSESEKHEMELKIQQVFLF